MVEKIKRAVEFLYTDRCCVYEKEAVFVDGRTSFEEKTVYEDVPCRLSVKAYLFGENAGSENNNGLSVKKKVKIFVPPEYEIKPGSRILLKGKNEMYAKSGAMSRYATHNEVMVELEKNYA